MSKKFSILQTIDLNKLDEQIFNYKAENNRDPYLFISKETSDAITREMLSDKSPYVSSDIKIRLSHQLKAIIYEYKGYKVYDNNDLEFGEVEIR